MVSIIVSVYNEEKHIDEMIKSVISQTGKKRILKLSIKVQMKLLKNRRD